MTQTFTLYKPFNDVCFKLQVTSVKLDWRELESIQVNFFTNFALKSRVFYCFSFLCACYKIQYFICLKSYFVPGHISKRKSMRPTIRRTLLSLDYWFGNNENLLALKNNEKYFAHRGNFSSLYTERHFGEWHHYQVCDEKKLINTKR